VGYEKNVTTDHSTQLTLHWTCFGQCPAKCYVAMALCKLSKTHTRALEGNCDCYKNDPSRNHRYNTRNRPTVGILQLSYAV